MNYELHYKKLIERSPKTKPENGYFERHHIIPRCFCTDEKCLGYKTKRKHTCGLDSPSNKVYLTAREHYVAHQLLVKIYPQYGGLAHAAWMMTHPVKKGHIGRVNNRSYEWLRLLHAKNVSKFFKNNRFQNKGISGYKWFNNGVEQGTFKKGTEPVGWVPGHLMTYSSEEAKQKAYEKLKIGQGWNKGNKEWMTSERLENLMKHVRGVPKPKAFVESIKGKGNPAYGSTYVWVNDGNRNYRWTKALSDLPANYKQGMIR